ncbi:Na+/H+ antiporter subunit G [Marinimicrobium alkaliphilum]|uniref:Na+/H+ antiporter subunit G n=1 Tax=Marinimicrobium alkaliphilum TaxID=2202654 RepID=UPI0018E0B8D5|nr:Na+/H+ antiporter subunit G [Marinimicrobium alkaliphilum]
MTDVAIPWVLELLIAVFLLVGALVALLGTLGLVRFPDFYTRLHAPTKASTLGVGCTLLGSMIYFSVIKEGISAQEVLITLFLFVTAPVSAHMMAKAALHRRVNAVKRTRQTPWSEE